LAASVAIGVGIVLARAAREREQVQRRERDRELGLHPGEAPAQAFKRMALGQLDLALELLEQSDGSLPNERAVHDTRKALKRLRALLRLLEGELGAGVVARENAALRKIAARLSGARDADVMLSTLDAMIARHPGKLRRRKGVRRLRRVLLREREQARNRTLGRSTVEQALIELRAFRARVALWRLPEVSEAELIAGGLARLYGQGRKRSRRAARRKGRDTEAMHDWRKRVKSLRYAAEMLERHVPAELTPSAHAKQLKRVARRAEHLGEALGEDHDLAELAGWIGAAAKGKRGRQRSSQQQSVARAPGKLLLKLIARRRRKLRKRTLRAGGQLYRHSPKRFVRGLS
jgi:CHAD domain-containing protein